MTDTQTDNDATPRLLSIQDAAQRLGVSERTIWRRVRAGTLNAVEIGGRTCIQLADIPTRDTATKPTGAAVSATDTPSDMPSDSATIGLSSFLALQEQVSAPYREQIRRLEAENGRLWQEVTAKQQTIDSLTRMLPAPQAAPERNPPGTRRGSWWGWLIIGLLALAVAGLVWWAFFAPIGGTGARGILL